MVQFWVEIEQFGVITGEIFCGLDTVAKLYLCVCVWELGLYQRCDTDGSLCTEPSGQRLWCELPPRAREHAVDGVSPKRAPANIHGCHCASPRAGKNSFRRWACSNPLW